MAVRNPRITGRPKGSKDRVPRPLSVADGDVYENWTVLAHEGRRRGGTGKTYHFWTCKCNHCGKVMSRNTSMIRGKFGSGCDCLLISQDAAFGRSIKAYRQQAKRRDLDFNLSFEEFKNLSIQDCHYCGREPMLNSYSSDVVVKIPLNGVDRVNSDLSYSLDNCVPCCGMCNRAKLDYPKDLFFAWIHRVSDFQRGLISSAAKPEPD